MFAQPPAASQPDHHEFGATLDAPFQPDASGARTITLHFSYPDQGVAHTAWWRLELLSPAGSVLLRWHGIRALTAAPASVRVRWDGRTGLAAPSRAADRLPPPGIYRLRLYATATTGEQRHVPATGKAPARINGSAAVPARPGRPAAVRIDRVLAQAFAQGTGIAQTWSVAAGKLPPLPLPAFHPLATGMQGGVTRQAAPPSAAPTTADGLPYTIYYGNLHSQTNHSDGGGDLASCHGAQAPQSAPFGPADAYAYARDHGLDFLMTSEHNHMYDGSEGTNAGADPAQAVALYRHGLRAAADFNDGHPGFVALYGQEWGVISNGGHLNIFNSDELLGWERNAAGQLLADTFSAKGDYAALYALMRQRGWIGQFNHPADKQFRVGGAPLAYTPDGDAAMVLCEVMNSSAFSRSGDESENRHSNYEAVCDQLLEAGYHLAFSSDQDNHCANWGASYSNRTGVLLPAGSAPGMASLLDALRARRVFATMDKQAQLIFTANGHLMGERFSNTGSLTLSVRYAGAAGRGAAELTVLEGVPGRNGSVSILTSAADIIITPSPGEHFYYARLTQDDGKMLWSAPVWVTQQAAPAPPSAMSTLPAPSPAPAAAAPPTSSPQRASAQSIVR